MYHKMMNESKCQHVQPIKCHMLKTSNTVYTARRRPIFHYQILFAPLLFPAFLVGLRTLWCFVPGKLCKSRHVTFHKCFLYMLLYPAFFLISRNGASKSVCIRLVCVRNTSAFAFFETILLFIRPTEFV